METTDMTAFEVFQQQPGVWSEAMKNTLRNKYAGARQYRGGLRQLADELGVGLYQLYSMAHRLGLSREIRRR
jgi:hypothetical protein